MEGKRMRYEAEGMDFTDNTVVNVSWKITLSLTFSFLDDEMEIKIHTILSPKVVSHSNELTYFKGIS